jgi:hypothetical protein
MDIELVLQGGAMKKSGVPEKFEPIGSAKG